VLPLKNVAYTIEPWAYKLKKKETQFIFF